MINPFKNITEDEKNILLKKLEGSYFHFNKNESILSTIRLNNTIGIVLEGTIQNTKHDYKGNKIIVEELNKNSVFGSEISLYIDGESDMIAKEETNIIILDKYTVLNYIYNNDPIYNQFLINLFTILTNIITLRNERIRLLTTKTTRDKLIEYFRILSKRAGSRTIHIPFTYTDLADYLGVDRSAMMREIKYLKEEKIIEVKSRRVTLLYR